MSGSDSTLAQLHGYGLIVDSLETGRVVKCRVDDDPKREKRAWYCVHAIEGNNGSLQYVGSCGIFRGAEHYKYTIRPEKDMLSPEQMAAARKRRADDLRLALAERQRKAEIAARRADKVWRELATENGECEYLQKKNILGYGLRYTKKGNALVPMQDINGKIHGLLILYGEQKRIDKLQRNKEFWPNGLIKTGHFYLIGIPAWIILVAEGYSTAASLHAATQLPVAVAFDAGNLAAVCEALRKRYREAKILICADDDYLPNQKKAGEKFAQAATLAVRNCAYVLPTFMEDRLGKKITDFNDLHQLEGLSSVRAQIEAKIVELNWRPNGDRVRVDKLGEGGEIDKKNPQKPWNLDDLLEGMIKIYDQEAVFDLKNRMILPLSVLRSNVPDKALVRAWQAHPDQHQPIFLKQVGFDPAMNDKNIKCNFWAGWPTQARPGSCDRLLELLSYLCNKELDSDIYQWLVKWLAYPIQNPGAKMKTSVVMHGPQGVGKNLFFEDGILPIYGDYGGVVDQNAIESQFNDWMAEKLCLIADEVVARQELYHTKNRLKGFVTGDRIRINPKNKIAYEERNHVNIIFLSNEIQPLLLDADDRRWAVIWTPEKLPQHIYDDVKAELDDGGSAALHHYLLNLDLGEFKPWTLPPMTEAKRDLIELSRDSIERFIEAWLLGDLPHVRVIPCKSDQLYDLYTTWCADQGISKPAPNNIMLGKIGKRPGFSKARLRYGYKVGGATTRTMQATFIFPPSTDAKPDPGQMEYAWLFHCVEDFSEGVSQWKQNKSKFSEVVYS